MRDSKSYMVLTVFVCGCFMPLAIAEKSSVLIDSSANSLRLFKGIPFEEKPIESDTQSLPRNSSPAVKVSAEKPSNQPKLQALPNPSLIRPKTSKQVKTTISTTIKTPLKQLIKKMVHQQNELRLLENWIKGEDNSQWQLDAEERWKKKDIIKP